MSSLPRVPRARERALRITAVWLVAAATVAAGLAQDSPRRLMVKMRPGADPAAIGAALGRAGARATEIRWVSRSTRWRSVWLAAGQDEDEAVRLLASEPGVEAVETEKFARISGTTPDDLMSAQWSLNNTGQSVDGAVGLFDADIDAPEAWDLARGSLSVTVAVLDTGVRVDHPDLGENLVRGYDVLDADQTPWDDAGAGHGTPVAGIIGAVGNNGVGITGINWDVSLLPVKVCDGNGICPYSAIVAGLEYAVRRGARVINMSLACDEHQDPSTGACGAARAGACRSQMLYDALAAARAAGVLAVVSAGNCGADVDDDTRAYPCAYDLNNVLCVGATDSRDELVSFSNYGPRHVRAAAPGSGVLSLSTDAATNLLWDGTSFAAPMAAGVAALQLSRNPGFTPAALAARLSDGDAMASLSGLVGGSSRVNALGAIRDLFLRPVVASTSSGAAANLTGDFDGDGLLDACEAGARAGHRVALGDGSGLGSFQTWSAAGAEDGEATGDFNGDGRDDIVRPGARGLEVMLSTGSGFAGPARWSAESFKRGATYAADVDGDGRDDIVRYLGKKRFWVSLSTGSGFGPSSRWSTATGGTARVFADFNGDGRDDMLRATGSGAEVSLSTGSSFEAPSIWGARAPAGALRAADVDGDGAADLVRRDASGGCWQVMISTGASLGSPRPWGCAPTDLDWSLGDVNGDLRGDLVTVGAGTCWQTMLSSR